MAAVDSPRRPAPGRTHWTGWNEDIALTKRACTMSDVLNAFSAAGLWIETTVEPQLGEEAARRHPHKKAWLNRYLGILIFKLRPVENRRENDPDHHGVPQR
ncbi:hypothetical protein [Lentzea sp. NPDC059081]|uniref:hypothetical protein n=1 Tax=Lentzea sp. NPDC059081 TaxID=3346719 RepID=UPI003689C356